MPVNNSQLLAYLSGSMSWGGLEMNHVKNAYWMHQRGHEVVLIGLKDSPFLKAAIAYGLTVVSIERHRKYYDFRKAYQLAKILASIEVTHLILRDNRDLSTAVMAKRFSKRKIHLSYFMEMQLGVKKKSLFHTLRYRNIDLWSCPLEWLKTQVLTMTNMPKDRIVVVHSGVELSRFSHLPDKSKARQLLDLPSELPIVGLIGRFDPHKGQLLLIEALKLLQSTSVQLCLLGEPTREEGNDYEIQMYDSISRLGLADRVHIRPFREDIETFYSAMDLIVMATKAETVGMVTIEALASGKPVIATNTGGSPEILKFGQFGRLVKPSDPEELSLEIEAVMSGRCTLNPNDLVQRAADFDHNSVCERVEQVLKLKTA
jgi:glycosyltransferase involved in cell wall biosynthesis